MMGWLDGFTEKKREEAGLESEEEVEEMPNALPAG